MSIAHLYSTDVFLIEAEPTIQQPSELLRNWAPTMTEKYLIERFIELIGDYEKCFGCSAPYEVIRTQSLEKNIAALRIAIGTRCPVRKDVTGLQRDYLAPLADRNNYHFRKSRLQMVRDQLRRYEWPVTSRKVLRAMRKVPREAFIPAPLRSFAYEDRPLPIGWGQTISQPYVVGLMTQLLNPEKTAHILEIGTGSGYQTAILAELSETVYSIERVPELVQRSKETLTRLGYSNVHVIQGDGSKGWPEPKFFDGILITCATPTIPEALREQLKPGGTIVAPVGHIDEQKLCVYIKENTLKRKAIIKVRFVPMLTSGLLRDDGTGQEADQPLD